MPRPPTGVRAPRKCGAGTTCERCPRALGATLFEVRGPAPPTPPLRCACPRWCVAEASEARGRAPRKGWHRGRGGTFHRSTSLRPPWGAGVLRIHSDPGRPSSFRGIPPLPAELPPGGTTHCLGEATLTEELVPPLSGSRPHPYKGGAAHLDKGGTSSSVSVAPTQLLVAVRAAGPAPR